MSVHEFPLPLNIFVQQPSLMSMSYFTKIEGVCVNTMLVSPLKDVVREEEPNMQVFSCNQCGEEFDVEDNCVNHMLEIHRVGDCVWCHHCKQLFYDSVKYSQLLYNILSRLLGTLAATSGSLGISLGKMRNFDYHIFLWCDYLKSLC